MLQQALLWCSQADIDAAIGSSGIVDFGNVWFYDGTKVYNQIAAYTGNPYWYTCAGYVKQAYLAFVFGATAGVNYPVGVLNGYSVFPEGLLMDYQRIGDTNAENGVFRLANYSAYAGSGGDAPCGVSRETAYIMEAYLAAEGIGQPRNPLLATSVNYALGHIDQWFVASNCPNTQPFMVGLTMEALIDYYEKTGDVRIPPAIRVAADGLWNTAWMPASSAFYYESIDVPLVGVADLNLLIASAYAWLWQKTGSATYLNEGDQVFAGGVLYGNYYSGKQFSQNYRWSFDYINWRSTPANSLRVTTTGFLFSRANNTFNGQLMVTNTGSQQTTGTIEVELTNLTSGVTLDNATGTTGGTPFITLPGTGALAPGQTATVNVQFNDPAKSLITFVPIAY